MNFRWRILSNEEITEGINGAVTVRRSEHYTEECVLEWQEAPDPQWHPVILKRKSVKG